MTPSDAEALDLFLREPRTLLEVAHRFHVTKVTAALWVRLVPTKIATRRQGARGPLSRTYQIDRAPATTPK